MLNEENSLEYLSPYLHPISKTSGGYKIIVNGIELKEKEQRAVSDHRADTNYLTSIGENRHIEIEIELEKAQELGILFIDFLQPEYGIKEVSCWYYDDQTDNYVLLDESEEIESAYEFYLQGTNTRKLKLIGSVTDNNVGNVMINEIIILEDLQE